MATPEVKTQLKRIAELKDQITSLTQQITLRKNELKDLLPHVKTFMDQNNIDDLSEHGGAYKMCRKAKVKQPTLTKIFIASKIDEYLTVHHVRNVNSNDIVEYIYEQRKSLSTQTDELDVRKMNAKKRKAEHQHVELDAIPEEDEETVFTTSSL